MAKAAILVLATLGMVGCSLCINDPPPSVPHVTLTGSYQVTCSPDLGTSLMRIGGETATVGNCITTVGP